MLDTELDLGLQMDSLHYAIDYIPKRALRFFTAPEHRPESIDLLLEEAQDVIHHPDEYIEEGMGNRLLFHAFLIFASLKEERAIPLIRELGLMDQETIDELLGQHLFEGIALAIGELCATQVDQLKEFIQSDEIDPCIRAACLQAMTFLYGRGVITRDEVVSYFLDLLKNPEPDLPFFYEVIAASAIPLYPDELIVPLRELYSQGKIDSSHIKLEEIEESLSLPKSQAIQEFRPFLSTRIEDPIVYLETLTEFQNPPYERNEPCPCGSGLKFKKCCQ